MQLIQQLAPWEQPCFCMTHQLPVCLCVCVCVCFGAWVSVVLAYMMSRRAWVRLFGGIAMVMSSACLCVCVLLPANPGGGLVPSLSILWGLTSVLWFPANFVPPLLIAKPRHAHSRAGTLPRLQARKYPSFRGTKAALDRTQSTC